MSERSFRQSLYPEFARVGAALASDKRLELLDLLAQSPRHVEALANETGMSVASVSQHLQVLRNAKLVEAERSGNRVLYRLGDESVLRLWLTLRAVAETRLPEVERITRQFTAGSPEDSLGRDELEALMSRGQVCLIDVRPRIEFDYGHLPGALSMPMDELAGRLDELPKDRRIITYCRGVYCAMSYDAEALLRDNGFQVSRLEGGWPEWWDEGRATEAHTT